MRSEIELKNGRRTKVHPLIAKHLQNRGIATVVGGDPVDGQYQTRAMTAQRGAPVEPTIVDPEPEQTKQPEEKTEAVELDSADQPWSADLHVATKIKNADGTWRKKPGGRAAESN